MKIALLPAKLVANATIPRVNFYYGMKRQEHASGQQRILGKDA
jgi:hypothetical protein